MSNDWKDPCGTVINGPRPTAPQPVTTNTNGIPGKGWFDGTNVQKQS